MAKRSNGIRTRVNRRAVSQWSIINQLPGQPIVRRRGGQFAALKRVGYIGRKSVNQKRTRDKLTPSAVLLYYTHNGFSKRWRDMRGAEQDRFTQKIIEGVIASRYGNHYRKVIPPLISRSREPSLFDLVRGRKEMMEKKIEYLKNRIKEGEGEMEQDERKAQLRRLQNMENALTHIAIGIQKGRFYSTNP